jgi:hypothetical protein
MMVSLDRRSMRLDSEAQSRYWTPCNHRGAGGQLMDLIAGQQGAALLGLRMSGNANRFVYAQDTHPGSQSRTGEHFYDTVRLDRHGRPRDLGPHPFMSPEQIALTKQALYGHTISDRYGEATTLVGQRFRNVRGVTVCRDGDDITSHLRENEAKGWSYSTAVTHTGNYMDSARGQGGAGGHRGGLHATSLTLSADGQRANFVNNWGGRASFNDVDTNQLVAWMDVPAPGFQPGGGRRQFVLPDGPGRGEGQRLVASRDDRPNDDPSKDQKREKHHRDPDKAPDTQFVVAQLTKQIFEANARLAQLTDLISSLPANEARRSAIIADSANAQGDLLRIMHQLRGHV